MKRIILLIIIMLMSGVSVFGQEQQFSNYEAADLFVSSVVGEDLFVGAEDEMVNRGDFVAAVAKLFKQDRVYSGSPIFTDVSDSDANYNAVSNACINGWISSGDKFFPYNNIKLSEAVKIIIWAANYDRHAENSGGYPMGYMMTAHRMELLDCITKNANDEITVSDAIIMLSNALKVEAIGVGKISGSNVQYDFLGTTIAYELYGLEYTEGVITQINKRSLIYGADRADNVIKIDGNVFFGENFDHQWLGYNVIAWYDEDGNIVSIVPEENTWMKVDIENYSTISDDRFVYFDSTKEKYKKLDTSYKVIYNGVRVAAIDDAYKDLNGSITIVDNNDDGMYDVVFVDCYEYAIVDNVDLVKNQIGLIGSNAVLDFEEAEDAKIMTVDGGLVEMFEIRRGQYVILKKSPYDGTVPPASYVPEFFEAYIGSALHSGTITGYNSTENLIQIDNTSYNMSKLFKDEYLPALKVGNEVMYAVGFGKDLVYAEKVMGTLRYGYALKIYADSGDEIYYMRILAENGKIMTYQFAKKLYIDGVRNTSGRAFAALGGASMEKQLIRYTINADGLLFKIDLAEDASAMDYGETKESDNNLLRYTSTPVSIRYRSGGNIFVPKFTIDGAVIFKVPQVADPKPEDYEVVSLNSLQGDQPYTVDVFNINEYGAAGAVLIYTTDTKPIRIASTSYLVEGVLTALNEAGDVGREIHAWNNGTYYKFFVSDDVIVENSDDNSITPGDVIRVWTKHGTLNGEVQHIVLDIDNTDSGVVYKESAQINMHSVGDILTGSNHLAGYVYAVGETGMVIGLNPVDNGVMNFDWSNVQVCRYTNAQTTNVAYFDRATGTLESGTIDSMRTYKAFGSDCHYVVVKMSSDSVSSVYIYE